MPSHCYLGIVDQSDTVLGQHQARLDSILLIICLYWYFIVIILCVSICLLCVWLVMVACYRLYLPPSPLLPAHYHCQGQTCTICVLVSVSVAQAGVPPTLEVGQHSPECRDGDGWVTSGCDIILVLLRPAQPRPGPSHQHTNKLVTGSLLGPLLSSPRLSCVITIQPAWY